MFGLTEFTAQFDEPLRQAIIPTFVLPFTILGMILTSLATWIAAFFGIQLKAEGPKRLFEVLMRPKIILWALISNGLFYAVYAGWQYEATSSRPLWLIESKNHHHPAKAEHIETQEAILSDENQRKKNLVELKLLWTIKISGGVFGGITSKGSALFMGTNNGKIFEIDSLSGKELRQFWVGQPVMTAPLILENNLFSGEGIHETHHARYYKFDLLNGEMVASTTTAGHIERTATVTSIGNKKILLTPAGKAGVIAIDSADMTTLWQAHVGHVDSYPITDGETVFVGTGLEQGFNQDGTFAYALELTSGKTRWKKQLPTSSWGRPILWKQQVCFSVGDVYSNTDYGQISCYDKNSGQELGAINLSGAVISNPILRGDKLIISDLNATIYQIDLATKSIDWRIEVPHSGLSYAPVISDLTTSENLDLPKANNQNDHLIIPGSDGLYIYSRQNQKLIYKWAPDEKWSSSFSNVYIKNNVWYLADSKGMVRALQPIYK